jgi:hypothetical protein
MVLKASQFYWWNKPEYPQKTINLLQVPDKLYLINVVFSSPCHEQGSNSHL